MFDENDPFVFDNVGTPTGIYEDRMEAIPCMGCSMRGGRPRPVLKNLVFPRAALKGLYEPSVKPYTGPFMGKGRSQILRERMLRSDSPVGSAIKSNSRSPCSSMSEERRPGSDSRLCPESKPASTSEHSEKEDSKPPQGDEEPFFAELDFNLKFPKVISNASIRTADEKYADRYGDRYLNRNPVKTGRGRSSGAATPFKMDSLFKVAPTLVDDEKTPVDKEEFPSKITPKQATDLSCQKPCKFGGAKPEPSETWSQELALRSEVKQHYELSSSEEEQEDDDSDPGYVVPDRYRSDFEHDPIFFTQVRKGTTLEDFIKPKLPKSKRKKLSKKKFEFPEYDAKMAAVKAGLISRNDDFQSAETFMTTSLEPAPEVESKHDFPDLDPAAKPGFGDLFRSDKKEWIAPKKDFRSGEEFPSLSAQPNSRPKRNTQVQKPSASKLKSKDVYCEKPPVFKKSAMSLNDDEELQAPPPNKDINIRSVATFLNKDSASNSFDDTLKLNCTKNSRNLAHTLYLENLPEECDEETIHALLCQYGEVQFCKLQYTPVGTLKAEIQLDSEDAVEWAVECMNGEDAVLAGEGQRITCYRHTGRG